LHLEIAKIRYAGLHQVQIHLDEVVLDAAGLRRGEDFFQSSVPCPTAITCLVSADQSCTCIEMKRPGYFVKYSAASKLRLMVETWN